MAEETPRVKQVEHSNLVRLLGMFGWICYGLVHLIIAGLAVQVALGDPREQTGPQGAVGKIAEQPLGVGLLTVLAAGLLAFASSQFLLSIIGFGWVRNHPTRISRQAGAAGRGVVALGIGVLAARKAAGGQIGTGNTQQKGLTAILLSVPAGQVLVGLLAAAILVVGGATVRRGVIRSFTEDLDMNRLPDGTRKWVERTGIAGWIAKGLAYAGIGALFGAAALNADAKKSGGLDQALHVLAAYPLGQLALTIIAVGFGAFGMFCFAAARAHRR